MFLEGGTALPLRISAVMLRITSQPTHCSGACAGVFLSLRRSSPRPFSIEHILQKQPRTFSLHHRRLARARESVRLGADVFFHREMIVVIADRHGARTERKQCDCRDRGGEKKSSEKLRAIHAMHRTQKFLKSRLCAADIQCEDTDESAESFAGALKN